MSRIKVEKSEIRIWLILDAARVPFRFRTSLDTLLKSLNKFFSQKLVALSIYRCIEMIDRPLEGSGGNPKIGFKNPKSVPKSQNPENLKIEILLNLNRKRGLLPFGRVKKPSAS